MALAAGARLNKIENPRTAKEWWEEFTLPGKGFSREGAEAYVDAHPDEDLSILKSEIFFDAIWLFSVFTASN